MRNDKTGILLYFWAGSSCISYSVCRAHPLWAWEVSGTETSEGILHEYWTSRNNVMKHVSPYIKERVELVARGVWSAAHCMHSWLPMAWCVDRHFQWWTDLLLKGTSGNDTTESSLMSGGWIFMTLDVRSNRTLRLSTAPWKQVHSIQLAAGAEVQLDTFIHKILFTDSEEIRHIPHTSYL